MISRDVSVGLFWAPHLTIPNQLPFRGLRQVPCYIESEALYLLKLVMVSYEIKVGGSLLPASTLLLILNPEVPNAFLRILEKFSVGFQTWLKPLIACQQLYILGPNMSLIFDKSKINQLEIFFLPFLSLLGVYFTFQIMPCPSAGSGLFFQYVTSVDQTDVILKYFSHKNFDQISNRNQSLYTLFHGLHHIVLCIKRKQIKSFGTRLQIFSENLCENHSSLQE